jgi:hypothetical protein
MELVVVPWAPGPLIRVEWPGPARDLKLGLPIDPSDPDVSALIGAYESLLAAATQGGLIAAGHVALREAASLLRWGPPVGPAEREYVRRRVRAVNDLIDPSAIEQLAYLRQAIGEPAG